MSEKATAEDTGSARERPACFCMGSGPEFFAMFKKLGPDSARQHFRNARIEFLKGMRELIDKRIEDLSKGTVRKGAAVEVE